MENKRKTIVVNFYAGPGAGKSTFCAATFAQLKWRDINCEMALEYAKDKVWEKSTAMLANQFYVFGKQQHRMFRLKDQVDVIITDGPLLNSIIYDAVNDVTFRKLIVEEYNRYDNINVFLHRKKKYNPKGRYQTEEEAKELDIAIFNVLNQIDPGSCIEVDGIPENVEKIVIPLILDKIEGNKKKPKIMLSHVNYKNPDIYQSYVDWIELELKGEVTHFLHEAEMLVVPGGVDIGVNPDRDQSEMEIIKAFVDMGKPIFGICRGLQLLGYMEGCELIQDIPSLDGYVLDHGAGRTKFDEGSSWHFVCHGNNKIFEVNSRHHQGFKFPALLNSDDGIVEAMNCVDVAHHLGRQGNLGIVNYFAVQWHPERKEMQGKDASKYVKMRIDELITNYRNKIQCT